MDFFSSVSHLSSTTYAETTTDFADAIAARFNSAQDSGGIHTVLTARLLTPRTPMNIAPPIPIAKRSYTAIKPEDIPEILKDPSGLLLLDLRPPTIHLEGHLPYSLSLSVPSTLLKRPTFPLARLAQMLPTAAARAEFLAWPKCLRIMVYDEDSDETMVNALLDKFTREGFKGELGFVEGGYRAVGIIQPSVLLPAVPVDSQNPPSIIPSGQSISAANPFFEAVRQNAELAHGITVQIPLRISAATRARAAAEPLLPPWISAFASRALPLTSETQSEPEDVNGHDLAESLALQFHRIELAEQRRLQGVMAHHAKESQAHSASAALSSRSHPFSITAGVEKGAKNRYRHIWPFEHARVRLGSPADQSDDYVNASHVHPIGTQRQYIATQGPLDATFSDFWTLVWEQNVHIIVMLTREIENAQVKCGRYWPPDAFNTGGSTSSTPTMTYGAITVTLLSTSPELQPPKAATAGFFSSQSDQPGERETITRILHIHHGPSGRTRRITHLQHVDWPDMDVPSSPSGIIRLLRQVNEARRQNADSDEAEDRKPVLLHCSAGVGRTGGFIAADAILDAIRRDVRASLTPRAVSPPPATTMDVDQSPSIFGIMEDGHTPLGSPMKSPMSSPPPPSRAATRAWANAVSGLRPIALSPTSPTNARQHRTLDDPPKRTIGLGLGGPSDSRSSSAPSLFKPMFGSPAMMTSPPSIQPLGSPFAFGVPPSGSLGSPPHSATAFSLPASSSLSGDSRPPSSVGSIITDPEAGSPSPPSWPAEMQATAPTPPNFPASSNDSSMDFTLPRGAVPGPELANLSEPVCAVIQDMREQRMSLCQSLRQYVFVHAVVVEGALAVIDEERARAGSLAPLNTMSLSDDEHTGGKRGASPTELIKEERQSGFALAKRPSIKRKMTAPDHVVSNFTAAHALSFEDTALRNVVEAGRMVGKEA